ncbi:hypothetical protein EVAR_29327_1 [Eumeta japonica]|uniref:Uncharacterized protein n=1 Tax=Eumeta variegata TaxID=151549 RepID=A0A4C1WGQ7_EUMVA|nr:hypothetical protein EVAR_29327_1 [Eumeta japonica]
MDLISLTFFLNGIIHFSYHVTISNICHLNEFDGPITVLIVNRVRRSAGTVASARAQANRDFGHVERILNEKPLKEGSDYRGMDEYGVCTSRSGSVSRCARAAGSKMATAKVLPAAASFDLPA